MILLFMLCLQSSNKFVIILVVFCSNAECFSYLVLLLGGSVKKSYLHMILTLILGFWIVYV